MSASLESVSYVLKDEGGRWNATFAVPSAQVGNVCAHSIMCQGAVFDLAPGPDGEDGASTVTCTFSGR